MEQLYLRFARWFVARYLKGYHLHKSPVRKQEVIRGGMTMNTDGEVVG
jgi:hypothetical protein